ncbi:hypothetical protein EX30DRAFT_396853 [Ascodesmis nigricans]|uniref:Uncharacterized protein n=1 Tax=Ascodesmis nigricans TaxID=341454 RepID=A0A4S2MTH5_9PEZI|nr:hypothetical protein EX30DRAFT_396853 [Ascodesmis nigricans]
METSTLPASAPTSVPPRHHHTPPSPISNSHETPRQFRSNSRSHIDAYRSPFDPQYTRSFSSSRNHSATSLTAMSPPTNSHPPSRQNSSDTYLSPGLSIPFSNFSLQDRDSISSGSPLGSYGHPVLTIRRQPSSVSSAVSLESPHDGDLIFPLSSRSPRLSAASEGLERRDSTASTSSTASRRNRASITSLPTDAECDPETCQHHHHRRQSISSTINVDCTSTSPPLLSPGGGDLEATISLEPAAQGMLIPLIDRPGEMAELLANPHNRPWVKMVVRAIGEERYKEEGEGLWVRTGRETIGDREWLRRSRALLREVGAEGWRDERLWREFCGMVGWDGGVEGWRWDADGEEAGVGGEEGMECIVEEEERERV